MKTRFPPLSCRDCRRKEGKMKERFQNIFKRLIQILIIASLAFSVNYIVGILSKDDSIWLGEAIQVVGSVFWGPLVGGLGTLLSTTVTDLLTYGNLTGSYMDLFEALAIALIGVIYRRLNPDLDKFGVREIVIFNFVQVLVNIGVLYLATPPVGVIFFGGLFEDMSRQDLAVSMNILGNTTFSEIISIALVGTILIAICTLIRKRKKEEGSFSAALHSIFKVDFLSGEYRGRAARFTIGILLAVVLTMIDGMVSGHVLGADALAATSLMFPITSFSAFMSMLFTTGCSNLCAIAKGEGDYERARRLFSLGLFTTIFLGVMQMLLFLCIKDFYFDYFTATQTIRSFAEDYYQFYVFVPLFMGLAIFLAEMVDAEGDDVLSTLGYLTSFIVNVGLSIVLAQFMGMGGLALGTLLSYISYLLVISIHFLKKSNTYRLRFWFSFRDLFSFAEHSLRSNMQGLCMFVASVAFTKAILLFWGSEYLIANTVLCAMLEVYEMINGPSEAAEYLFATYTGEKNKEGMKRLFYEALSICLFAGVAVAFLLLLLPDTILLLYGIEDTPLRVELIKCIRYCAIGTIAAAVGGFLSDYYGNTGKPLWGCMMVIFRTALFPGLFCVTFCLDGGIVMMGIGMLLAQIFAVAIFYGFVLIVKGAESIPLMLDDPDYEKVEMNSFTYEQEEYERLGAWIKDRLSARGMEEKKTEEILALLLALCKQTEEKNGGKKVLGECVIRLLDKPEIILKDNGELMEPEIQDARLRYDVLMARNSNKISIA